MKKIELRVIAPTMATDKSPYKFNAPVDMVIMRCTTGDLGILPGRVPVSMVLGTGILRVLDEENEKHIAIMGGIAHVSDDIVTVLSDAALNPDEIEIEKVQSELKELRSKYEETTDLLEKTNFRDELNRLQVLVDVGAQGTHPFSKASPEK
ncbi:MAG: ATP synthase F1 subunit epsilon [Defluviitaleaceae bacterium]|nr:ATP synthase F1 subunit epsilon [Defluviitaleaceae bacterium]